MKKPKNILITGASSGLGAALAESYADQGISLFITGRNEDRLANVAGNCRLKGALVTMAAVDVLDKNALQKFIGEADAEKPLDLVIANAGISETLFQNENSADGIARVFSTNLNGVLHTIHPAIDAMKKRGKGQIALISSLASFLALPSAPSYSASKAAVRFYGEAMRGALKGTGIEVSVVCPGFIKTPMTDINNFYMPLLTTAEKAADKIKKRLENNPVRIVFPWPLYILMWVIGLLPVGLSSKALALLPKKP